MDERTAEPCFFELSDGHGYPGVPPGAVDASPPAPLPDPVPTAIRHPRHLHLPWTSTAGSATLTDSARHRPAPRADGSGMRHRPPRFLLLPAVLVEVVDGQRADAFVRSPVDPGHRFRMIPDTGSD